MVKENSMITGAREALAIAQGKMKPGRVYRAYTAGDIKAIRAKLDMTQEEFSTAFHLPVGTVRQWESGRRKIDSAAQSLLTVINKKPKAVMDALNA